MRQPVKLFQLIAYGVGAVMENSLRVHSKRVFLDRSSAEAYIDQFRASCLTERNGLDFGAFSEVREIKIVELECWDSGTED